MPLSALALVLLAALLHAAWNLAAKKAGGDHHFIFLGAVLIVLLWAPLGLWFAWRELPQWGALHWMLAVASGLIHAVYFNLLLAGYRAADLTVVYPTARGSGPLLTALGAALWLDESLGPLAWAGVVAMSGGIWLIAGGPGLRRSAPEAGDRARIAAGLGWGALTGLSIAAYTLVDGYAVKVLLITPILYDYMANLMRLPFLVPLVWRDRPRALPAWRAQWRYALVLAVCSPAAYVLVLYAMTLAPVSHVAPARELSMLFAALLGGRLLGEADRGLRVLGAGCMAAGVALLTLA